METEVLIVGGGPSGLAISACLNTLSIPNLVLEREDCYAPLWKKWTYDRLHLHLAKQFCELPNMPHPASTPTFMPRDHFLRYLDAYVARFRVTPRYRRSVESATFDGPLARWVVAARDAAAGQQEVYTSRFLVVASGENAEGVVPGWPGLEGFPGEVMHSREYRNGGEYRGRRVLVVGSGNSGMEIAFDLCQHGAETSIAVRGPFHFLTKRMVYMGMVLLRYFSVQLVDAMVLMMCRLKYGDTSNFGIVRPAEGPFYLKAMTGRSPVIDVGTIRKIKSRKIQVLKEVTAVKGDAVAFADGETRQFDVIILATGYKSTATKWLKDDGGLLNGEGWPRQPFPNHWKGKNGLYCAGLSRRGLAGVSMDAKNVVDDINKALKSESSPHKEMEKHLKTT